MTGRVLETDATPQEFLGEFYRPSRSPWLTTALKVLREPFAATAAAIILIFTVCAVFAPVLAPYSPTDQQALEASPRHGPARPRPALADDVWRPGLTWHWGRRRRLRLPAGRDPGADSGIRPGIGG
ncbi:MAG: hypothetical protein DYG91_12710 [Chloroflexi bacterium CFX7]|nr:hypothetical protein [Chloroflexi bacterium CFX7]